MLRAVCLVSLGDLLRMALERRENEITLQSELEFVGKYLEIEQTRFHDRPEGAYGHTA